MTEVIVDIKNACKKYGDSLVLDAVNQQIKAGEVIGVVGPNGGGKSTLLMMMAGLQKPTSGTIDVCGKPAHLLALQSAGLVGLVLARPGLYPLLSGWENLNYFGGLFGLKQDEVKAKADGLLDTFELTKHMGSPLGTWSTGMQQKLSLVRALLLSPRLLLVDEPAANLDPVVARSFYEELRRRADSSDKPLACVCVTHDLNAAEAISDRVWVVQGRVKEELKFKRREASQDGPILEAWKRLVI